MSEVRTCSIDEAAKRVPMDRGRLRALVHADRVPHIHTGKRKVRIPIEVFDAWIDSTSLSNMTSRT